jgi:DNA polymerase-4
MPTFRALKICPNAVVLPPRFDRYKEISSRMGSLFLEYTDLVEPIALDESYLDVTVNKKDAPHASAIAKELKQRIREELHLPASAGVGPNKFIAKIASGHGKPDGLVVVTPDKIEAFLHPLPISKMWGVGEVTEKKLVKMGITTIGELARCGDGPLSEAFGKLGRVLFRLANGIDERPVVVHREPKSISRETTFPKDTDDLAFMTEIIGELSRDVAKVLQKREVAAKTITLKIRYDDFTSGTRSLTAGEPVDTPDRILQTATELLKKTDAGQRKVRLVGVGASGLVHPGEPRQLSLF